jgi:hypothetical protein
LGHADRAITPPRSPTAAAPERVDTVLVGGRPTAVALPPRGSLIYVAGIGNGLGVVELPSLTMRRPLPVLASALVAAVAPDGCRACAGDCGADGSTSIAELVTGVNLALDGRRLREVPPSMPTATMRSASTS